MRITQVVAAVLLIMLIASTINFVKKRNARQSWLAVSVRGLVFLASFAATTAFAASQISVSQ